MTTREQKDPTRVSRKPTPPVTFLLCSTGCRVRTNRCITLLLRPCFFCCTAVAAVRLKSDRASRLKSRVRGPGPSGSRRVNCRGKGGQGSIRLAQPGSSCPIRGCNKARPVEAVPERYPEAWPASSRGPQLGDDWGAADWLLLRSLCRISQILFCRTGSRWWGPEEKNSPVFSRGLCVDRRSSKPAHRP